MISIIVPVYNVREYIERCIASILNQTYLDYEVILVDDGSTDGSGEMCDTFSMQYDKIKAIHQKNQGLSAARNTGIRAANGEVLSFVDSDDWTEPQMLQSMMEAMLKYGADIVICRAQMVSSQNRIEQIVGFEEEKVMSRIEATKEILKDENIPSFAWNKIYRKELFDGIEYPVGRIFEDTATTYKVFYKANRVVTIPYIGYDYRINPQSLTRQLREDVKKFIKRDLDNALAFNERYQFAKAHSELDEVVPLCAFKAYQMMRAFIHLAVHKNFSLTKEQERKIDDSLKKMSIKDLSLFNFYNRLDLILFKISKKLLLLYLKLTALLHPIEFEIK